MLLITVARIFSLLRQTLLPSPFPGVVRYLQRLLVLLVFLPMLLLLQLMHWLGFLLDEILFRGYRDIDVKEPVFVLGVPRSGTTFMHRLLAHHDGFTTFTTWECFLAPSITERYLWLGFGALDRRIGRPFGRLLGWVERRLFGWLDDVHPMSFAAPEEDYFALLPVLSCFILIVPFPEADWLWRLGRFDRDASPEERERLLRWYRRCLQKHLYVRGRDKVLLSKNASFAGMAGSLVDEFPDCRLIVCERDALAVIHSQFNSLKDGMRLFGVSENDLRFKNNLLDCLNFYYENLDEVSARHPERQVHRVPLWSLSTEPRTVMTVIADRMRLPIPPALDAELTAYEAARKPGPRPAVTGRVLAGWGFDADELGRRFSAWRHDEGLRI